MPVRGLGGTLARQWSTSTGSRSAQAAIRCGRTGWSSRQWRRASTAVALRPYHSALVVRVPEGRFVIEQAPIRDSDGGERGVVAHGAVGSRRAGRFRIFRYEVRRWRDGVIPDIGEAVESPQQLTGDPLLAQRVLDLVPACRHSSGDATRASRGDVELQLVDLLADRPQWAPRRVGASASGWARSRVASWRRGRQKSREGGVMTTVELQSYERGARHHDLPRRGRSRLCGATSRRAGRAASAGAGRPASGSRRPVSATQTSTQPTATGL